MQVSKAALGRGRQGGTAPVTIRLPGEQLQELIDGERGGMVAAVAVNNQRCQDDVAADDDGAVVTRMLEVHDGRIEDGTLLEVDDRLDHRVAHRVRHRRVVLEVDVLERELGRGRHRAADHEDGDFLKDVNPDSLTVVEGAALEPYVAELPPGSRVQFERTGYFSVDKDSAPGQVSMNRIVTLRDTWGNK